MAASVIATTLVPIAAVAAPIEQAANVAPNTAAKPAPPAEKAPIVDSPNKPQPESEPAIASVAESTADEVIEPVPDGSTVTIQPGGTEELSYTSMVSFADLPESQYCEDRPSAYVLATTPAGTSSWADWGYTGFDEVDAYGKQLRKLSLNDTGLRYPGGDITLSYYGKKANGFDCLDTIEPKTTDGLVAYKTTTLKVDWTKPEVRDVYTTFNSDGDPKIRIEVDPSWINFDTYPEFGGVSIFTIKNYNTDKQTVSPATMPCWSNIDPEPGHTGLICEYNGGYPGAGTAIGVAALPDTVSPADVKQWPPAEAISHDAAISVSLFEKYTPVSRSGSLVSGQCLAMCTGDPIDTSNGNFYEAQTDLSIAGQIGLSVDRRYAVGLLGIEGPFGDGTALNYNMHLKVDESTGSINVFEPTGSETPFAPADDQYRPLIRNVRADLTKTTDGWAYKRWDEELTYLFDAQGLLARIVDPNKNQVLVERINGQVSKVSEGDRSIEFAWDGGRLITATDHTGRAVTYQYNDDGRLSSRTDPSGGIKKYEYDSSGRVSKMTFEDGTTTTNSYDAENRITEQVLPSGKSIELSYGEPNWNGEVVTTETVGDIVKKYRYDERGRIREFTDSSDSTAQLLRQYYSDDTIKSEQSSEDGVPKSYQYEYAGGNLSKIYEQYAKSTQTFEYDSNRRMTAYVNALGIRTENDYDAAGNLVQTTTTPNDGTSARVTEYAVDEQGNTVWAKNPLGGITSMSYDGSGQLTSMTEPTGGVTTFNYDDLGQIMSTIAPGGNVDGIAQAEKDKFVTSYAYDNRGNALSVTDRDGPTTYTYDSLNRPLSITDPRGMTKSVDYDPSGQPKKITYPDGSTDQFTYDPSSEQRASWTDPQGLTTTYSRDGLKQVTTLPDGSASAIKRSANWGFSSGSLTTQIFDSASPNGKTVSTVDATESLISPSSNRSDEITVKLNKAGLSTSETRNGQSVTYAYDGFGQLTGQSGTDRNVDYIHDLAGNITGITYPDGTTVSRALDAAGRIVKITDWNGAAYDIAYNVSGRIASVSSDTGLKYEAVYDGNRLVSKNWSDELDAVIASFGSAYETTGELSSDSITVGSQPSTDRQFQWNDNGALAAVDDDLVSWDGRLLTSAGDRDLAYSASTGRLNSAVKGGIATQYSYDQHGNRLTATTGSVATDYSWNRLNQLMKLGDTAYAYSANGIRSQVGGDAQVYGQDLKLLSDGETKYLWSPDGSLLAQAPLNSTTKAETQLAVTDGMGSVYAVLDDDHSVVGEYRYSAFGERTLVSGQDVSVMGFTSEQHDESGLIYLRYRYLDPTVGQFISVDPLMTTTLDPYGYADGNPLQMTDPLGLFSWRDAKSFGVRIIKYIDRNSGILSTITGAAALALGASVIGAPLGMALGVTSYALNIIATNRARLDGDTVGMNLGIATMLAFPFGIAVKTGRELAPVTPAAESAFRALATTGKAPGFYNDMRTIAQTHWRNLTCF